jgi:hypothetical protein
MHCRLTRSSTQPFFDSLHHVPDEVAAITSVGRIRKAGEAAGLVHVATLSRADELGSHLYGWVGKPLTLRSRLLNRSPLRIVKQFITSEVRRLDNGIVVMRRPEA